MDMNQLMQQAQKMQADLERAQEEVKELTYTATSGGGVVEATASGDGRIASLRIDPEVVDAQDVEMLQDMVLAAVNEALRGVAEAGEERMSSAAGFELPDLSGLAGLF